MTADEYVKLIQKRRRQALDRIVRAFPWPPVKRASRVLEMNVRTITQLRKGDYPICERRARIIEERLGLEYGTLDAETGTR